MTRAFPLRGNPLHDETGGEERLRDETEEGQQVPVPVSRIEKAVHRDSLARILRSLLRAAWALVSRLLGSASMISEPNRARLLQVARQTIQSVLAGSRPGWNLEDFDQELRRPAGAFVTLTERGNLRGCIGSIQAVAPLVHAVATSAINAAFRDPRFPPVSAGEWPRLSIEISVMGAIVPVEDVTEIEVGRDGLIVSRGGRSGLLLPQVATDYGWDRETFLQQTCLKAGLPPDAWQAAGTRIERFPAEVFGESEA